MPTLSQERTNLAPTVIGIGLSVAVVMAASVWGTAPSLASSMAPATTRLQRSAVAKAAEAFVPNMGQWDAQALFLARSPGVDAWVTESGVVYDFFETRAQGTGDGDRGDELSPIKNQKSRISNRRGHVVRMEFVGGFASPVRGEGLLDGRFNYFLGSDESRWASNVPRFAEVRSERVYDGVEARWYFDQGRPRYDLIVAPGADPGKILMRFEGAAGLGTDGKSLNIRTSLGDVRQSSLFAYQKVGGGTKQVPASFVVKGATASFKVGDYDTTKPLVIDPLIWATFLGGASFDESREIALDDAGNAVVTGYTFSPTFPTTVGAYDQTYDSSGDVFVAKVSANGASLLFGTFLGGADRDEGASLGLDTSNQIVVVGETESTDFPTTAGAHDKALGGTSDAFVAKLVADGSALVFCTYVGGSSADSATSVALGAGGVPFLTGSTSSTDFPTSATAFDQTYNGGSTDAFATRMKFDGSALSYSSFLGGSSTDFGVSIALAATNNAVILGSTNSVDFPTTVGAFDQVAVSSEAFVVKVSDDGETVQYSTFLGGSISETPEAVALDAAGNAYVTGQTTSADFPTTAGALDQTVGGAVDAFVAKISADGSTLLHGTYLGGANTERGHDIAIDGLGNVVVAGYNFTGFFPVTAGAYDTTYNGGYDVFVSRLSPDLSTLLYSTYLGGSLEERAYSLALDSANNVLLAGVAYSGFPATVGAFDETYNGLSDGFLAHMAIAPALLDATVPKDSFIGGFSVPLTVTLNQPADPGDTIVTLTTDTPGKVFVSQTKLKVGKSTKTFGVRTETVKVDTPISITALCNGVSKTVNFTLKPGGLLNLKLNPTSLSSFGLGLGLVTLSAPAPAGARTVLLDSSKSSLLFVPVAVDVEEGETEAVFPTFAGPIAASTQVTVSARLGTMKKTATLTVNP